MLRTFWRRLKSLLRISQLERDMNEELRFHLERQTEENIGRGMDPEAARRLARLSFGGVE